MQANKSYSELMSKACVHVCVMCVHIDVPVFFKSILPCPDVSLSPQATIQSEQKSKSWWKGSHLKSGSMDTWAIKHLYKYLPFVFLLLLFVYDNTQKLQAKVGISFRLALARSVVKKTYVCCHIHIPSLSSSTEKNICSVVQTWRAESTI